MMEKRNKLRILLGILTIVPLLSTCATVEVTRSREAKFDGINKQFASQVSDFTKEISKMPSQKVTMGFSSLKNPTVGVCKFGMSHGGVEIEIDKGYWAQATDLQRKVLIFHELGHCVCWRGHDHNNIDYPNLDSNKPDTNKDSYFSDGCPKSIMYPKVLVDFCTKKYYDEYVAELKNNCEVE